MKWYLSHKQRSSVWLSCVKYIIIIWYESECNFDRIGESISYIKLKFDHCDRQHTQECAYCPKGLAFWPHTGTKPFCVKVKKLFCY